MLRLRMEALYARLYDKYCKLKKKKLSELDEVNKEQEEKFLSFVSAAEDLIEHLRGENENLQGIVENLRSEMSSIRSAKDKECAEYQKLFMEEERKNKALSEEVDKLKELLQEGLPCSYKDESSTQPQTKTPESAQMASRKRNRKSEDTAEEAMISTHISNHDKFTPECCKRTRNGSNGLTRCTYQALGEYLLGMKLSTVNQVDGVCITALHPSSGYSFSLTWVNNSAGEEAELLYTVLSLGTFERVAPEWMRDVMMFSTSMCPVFFKKVSQVIKLHA